MKLVNIPQPKNQYNHQTENKVTIINFWQLLLIIGNFSITATRTNELVID